ncbi:hypothetical protein KPH14_011641 [Odynerus spinipes]|uniref:Uncharacterized protein n=1 Tax=Odynerus spinipes TaxID=1348599 RepID=A0AAD9REV5_9HYME|nr:hypothetical protein KPH14_011641 [Odynerus spinipes]
MAMVISPRSKIVTLALLIGIITLVALIITGVIGFWNKTEKAPNNSTKMVSSKLQQFTGYTATKHICSLSRDAAAASILASSPFDLHKVYELGYLTRITFRVHLTPALA